ncbi:MAG: ABC transporter substrate-binding protein [SAR202 cluster bacterium]|nr:ABC transporter substrate-binding protein [SAR202 cluster bacterium]
MNKKYVWFALVLLVTALSAAVGCSGDDGPAKTVTFMAGFKPQANLPFVAAYVAQEEGYFEDEGLTVDIKHSTGEHLNLLMSGDVDFTTADANSVLKRRADPELPIVAIALFGQSGQQAFVSLSESGIGAPIDWEGATFGYKISVPPDYLAILEATGVDRSKIREVRVGFDPRVLTEGQVDLLAVFKSNEPDTLRGLGFDVTVFDAADYGVPTLGLTYITRQDLIDDESDTVRRFVKATMKGLEFALDNTEETLDIVMKYAENEDREHMRFMLLTELEDAESSLTQSNGLGWMTAEQWQAFHDSLLAYEALAGSVDVTKAFTTKFLE